MAQQSYKLVQMTHGSHLYGTATEASDYDYKSVALADPTDVLLGRVPRIVESQSPSKADGAKNQPGDVELQVFSLHHFMHLALKGETVAVDMLHAPLSACQMWTDAWCMLRDNRHRFYTRNMKSLVGYARAQAAKYGLRGSRLAAAKQVHEQLGWKALREHPAVLDRVKYVRLGFADDALPSLALRDIERVLPTGEHVRWHAPGPKDNALRMYEVCGMRFPETAKVGYVAERVGTFVDRYGSRAKLAESNQGVDWKAISHALRAAYQLRHIFVDGGFEYPLPESAFLRQVKMGSYTYAVCGLELETAIDQVERLAAASSLPDKPDVQWAEDFLMRMTRSHLTSTWSDEARDKLSPRPTPRA